VKYLKKYNLITESVELLTQGVEEILQEIVDDGLVVDISDYTDYIDIRISRPSGSPDRSMSNLPTPPSKGGKYPGELFFWFEVKDAIIRLTEWYYGYREKDYTPGINYKIYSELRKMGIDYKSSSPMRFFFGYGDNNEFGIGWSSEKDFEGITDTISFSKLIIKMKI
jgi:hypothetical protein